LAYVDLGELNYITLAPGWYSTVWATGLVHVDDGGFDIEQDEFQPGQWFRAAPWLDRDNSPGVSIVIGDSGTAGGRSGEAVSIDDNGNVNLAMTVVNVGTGTAAIGIQWLSAPQLGE
jgi:hypothetical protein